MELEEKRLHLISNGWASIRRSDELKAELVGVYKQIGQDICNSCPSVLYEKYNELKHLNLKITIPMKDRRIFLRSDSLTIPYTGESYTKRDMTEEQAIKVIKQNPDRAASFELAPGVKLDELLKEYDVKGKKAAAVKEAVQPEEEPQSNEDKKSQSEDKKSSGKESKSGSKKK